MVQRPSRKEVRRAMRRKEKKQERQRDSKNRRREAEATLLLYEPGLGMEDWSLNEAITPRYSVCLTRDE